MRKVLKFSPSLPTRRNRTIVFGQLTAPGSSERLGVEGGGGGRGGGGKE